MIKKILLTILLLLLTGCVRHETGTVGAGEKSSILTSIENIDSIQKNYTSPVTEYKKYKQMTGTTTDGVAYKVDEYVVWGGEKTPKETGYIITYTKSDGSTMATGTGEYAKKLSYDWTSINSISTTSDEKTK